MWEVRLVLGWVGGLRRKGGDLAMAAASKLPRKRKM